MTDKMREEFEMWASGKGLILRKATSGKQFYYLFEDTDYAWEAWQAARTVPEASSAIFSSRCPMCSYQHGHQIGCENNPIDIALRAIAQGPKK